MALFTDGTISTLEELRGYESAIYDVASTERIDLSQKLALAQQELEIELTGRVFDGDTDSLSRVVVTAPLRLWHTFHTLAIAYRDAYNSHLNDRYQGKWREYQRLADWASKSLFEAGAGMVSEPVPKAQPPVLSTAAGEAQAAMYWVRVAWVSQAGEEGCPSDPGVLSAPEGTVPVAEAGEAPPIASGWNVYAGLSIDDSQLQNTTLLTIGTSWVMPVSGLVSGKKAGQGQLPSVYKRTERLLRRG
jgi:hypothetical protein